MDGPAEVFAKRLSIGARGEVVGERTVGPSVGKKSKGWHSQRCELGVECGIKASSIASRQSSEQCGGSWDVVEARMLGECLDRLVARADEAGDKPKAVLASRECLGLSRAQIIGHGNSWWWLRGPSGHIIPQVEVVGQRVRMG